MTSKKEKHISSDETKNFSELTKTFNDGINNLVNRVYNYSAWATNVSFATFGFIIAITIQFKMAEIHFDFAKVIIVFICLSIAIIIGFFVRIKYELFDTFNILKQQMINLSKVINELNENINPIYAEEILSQPGWDKTIEYLLKTDNKISIKILLFQISIQFIMIFISQLYIVKIVVEYIFQ